MKIVLATENDIPKIQEIAHQSWQENYAGIISQEQIDYMLGLMYSSAEIQSQFDNVNYHYYFIENDVEKRIGIMGFEKNAQPNSTKLHRLYLLKSEKGKGYGKLAIQFLKIWTKNSGNSKIILNVNKFNPAKEFYQNLGFTIYDEGVFDIGNGYVMDDYLMKYEI